jgi:hypothetical protein
MVDLIHNPLLAHTRFMLAQRGDATASRGPMVSEVEGEARDTGRIALPAIGGQPLGDRFQGTEHDAVCDAHQTPAASRAAGGLALWPDGAPAAPSGQRAPGSPASNRCAHQ